MDPEENIVLVVQQKKNYQEMNMVSIKNKLGLSIENQVEKAKRAIIKSIAIKEIAREKIKASKKNTSRSLVKKS